MELIPWVLLFSWFFNRYIISFNFVSSYYLLKLSSSWLIFFTFILFCEIKSVLLDFSMSSIKFIDLPGDTPRYYLPRASFSVLFISFLLSDILSIFYFHFWGCFTVYWLCFKENYFVFLVWYFSAALSKLIPDFFFLDFPSKSDIFSLEGLFNIYFLDFPFF